MRPYCKYVIPAAVIMSFSSCKNLQLQKQLEKFTSQNIVLNSEKFRQISDGINDTTILDIQHRAARLIVYVDSLECSSCKVSHMYEYRDMIDFQNTVGEQYLPVFVFSPRQLVIKELLYRIRTSYFDYPIWLDENGAFPKSNPHIPADSRFHTFLLDKNGKVVLVGDPSRNPPFWELYKTTINQLIENGGVLPDLNSNMQ